MASRSARRCLADQQVDPLPFGKLPWTRKLGLGGSQAQERTQWLLDQLQSEDQRERSASRTEINKRFSFPFACIAFAIIVVPLGVTAHRRETSIGFAMGLIIAVSYFLFVIIGDTLRGNPNVHPELLVWFPNVLFIVLGAFLFRRLARQ